MYQALEGAAIISGVWHDLGKYSHCFQNMLSHSIKGERIKQKYRHEYISWALFLAYIQHHHIQDMADLVRHMQRNFSSDLCLLSVSLSETPPVSWKDMKISDPYLQSIANVVLTHHGLIDINLHEKLELNLSRFYSAEGVGHQELVYCDERLDHSIQSIFRKTGLIAKVASIKNVISNPSLGIDIGIISRMLMQAGDYVASMENEETPRKDRKTAYAKSYNKKYGDSVHIHIEKVCSRIADVCTTIDMLRATHGSKNLTTASTGRFEWQDRACASLSDHIEGNGFIGLVIAGTGSGKTRGCLKIMNSLSTTGLRVNTLLGLRDLALQTGDAYKGLIPEDDYDTVIGGHNIHDLTGDVEEGNESIGNITEVAETINREDLVNDFVGKLCRTDGAVNFLQRPVIVSTIDFMIPASNLKKNSNVDRQIRLLSSDLIIDEFDNYSVEDRLIIGRMIWLAGLLNRKVLISSATLSEQSAQALINAYCAGNSSYREMIGSGNTEYAIISEYESSGIQIDNIECITSFYDRHFENIAQEKTRRRLYTIETPEEITPENLISSEVRRLHGLNHSIHYGVRVSAGIIRLNRIRDCRDIAKHFAENGCDTFKVIIACLHSRFPAIVRHNIEKKIGEVFKRKTGKELEAYADPDYQDVVILLVTTNLVETGRDFDADWAITEPCSDHSIVQLAGRVRRHRYEEYLTPNMAILMNTLRNSEGTNNDPGAMVISHPGFDDGVGPRPKRNAVNEGYITSTPGYRDYISCFDYTMYADGVRAYSVMRDTGHVSSTTSLKIERGIYEGWSLKDISFNNRLNHLFTLNSYVNAKYSWLRIADSYYDTLRQFRRQTQENILLSQENGRVYQKQGDGEWINIGHIQLESDFEIENLNHNVDLLVPIEHYRVDLDQYNLTDNTRHALSAIQYRSLNENGATRCYSMFLGGDDRTTLV